MNIGDVSTQLGLPVSTIRYYERTGLIGRQRRVSGRRTFDQQALITLRFIQLAKSAGFRIAEIKRLQERYADATSPAEMWRPLVEAKRAVVRQRVEELEQMDRVLASLTHCQCTSLSECVQAAVRRQ